MIKLYWIKSPRSLIRQNILQFATNLPTIVAEKIAPEEGRLVEVVDGSEVLYVDIFPQGLLPSAFVRY